MKNDVFERKEYVIYVINETTKVNAVKQILFNEENFGGLIILDHQECCNGKYYVWHISSWDAMLVTIKYSLSGLIIRGVCEMGDIKMSEYYKEES